MSEVTLEKISKDFKKVNSQYLKKLKAIDKGKFLTEKEFEKALTE